MTPIVLHHGLLGWRELRLGRLRVSYFTRIDRAITERGYPVLTSSVHPTGGIERRARELKATILRGLKGMNRADRRIVIIGHSMGGLDARYMVSRLGMADRVAAVVTVTTPHRGSPYADWCLRNLGERLGGTKLVRALNMDMQAVADLTTESCASFNEQVPDVPGVRYYSVSCARPWHRVPPFALHAYNIVYKAEGDNDAVVSVASSTWGTHLGTWPADHWHAINHRMVLELKDRTGDISPYYLKILDRLSEDGIIDAPQNA